MTGFKHSHWIASIKYLFRQFHPKQLIANLLIKIQVIHDLGMPTRKTAHIGVQIFGFLPQYPLSIIPILMVLQ